MKGAVTFRWLAWVVEIFLVFCHSTACSGQDAAPDGSVVPRPVKPETPAPGPLLSGALYPPIGRVPAHPAPFIWEDVFGGQDSLLSDILQGKPVKYQAPEDLELPEVGPLARVEFTPGAVERGEADEPEISRFGDDWSNEVEVRTSVEQTDFRQLQRVRVTVEVRNVSGRHFWLPSTGGNVYAANRVRVFSAKGKLVPMTRFYKNEGHMSDLFNRGNPVSALNPGESRRFVLIPNLVYDMTRPGDYWLLIEVPFLPNLPPVSGMKSILYARAKPIKVKVVREPFWSEPNRRNPAPRPNRP